MGDIGYILFFLLVGLLQIYWAFFKLTKQNFFYEKKYEGLRNMFSPLPNNVSLWFMRTILTVSGSFLIFFSFYSFKQ